MLYTGERNYGCRFLEISLYGLRTIILENEKIRIMFLLDKGTEIIEFIHKETDTDFIWRSPLGLSCLEKSKWMRKDDQLLTDNYTGGWFEAFPNLGGSCVHRGAQLPVYGEVCYLPWEYKVLKDEPEEVQLSCFIRTTKMPFFLEKVFTVKSGVPSLFLEEKVTNLGRETLEFQWGHHPNFGSPFLDGNCCIDLPDATINVYSDGKRARLSKGAQGSWPVMTGRDGQRVDFSQMLPPDSGVSDLLFLTGLKEGWAAVRNTKKGVGFGLSWDVQMFNNCVYWMVANGDEGYPRYGDTYVLCLLPKNADIHCLSEGVKTGDCSYINKGETKTSWLTATAFKDARKVKHIDQQGNMSFDESM